MINPIPNSYGLTEITFYTESDIKAGMTVSVDKNGNAIIAPENYPFIGICTKAEGNYITVAVSGVITAGYTGAFSECGYQYMSGDGNGNIKYDITSDYEHPVLKVDTENRTVTIIL